MPNSTEIAKMELEKKLLKELLERNDLEIVCTNDRNKFDELRKTSLAKYEVESETPIIPIKGFGGCVAIRRNKR